MILPRSQSFPLRFMAHTLRRSCPPHTRISRKSGSTSSSPIATASGSSSFHTNSRYLWPIKDSQDKDSLKPRSTEYSKSGSDESAAHDDAAFDPNTTRPETEQKQSSESENPGEGASLSVSPGNPEVSKARDPQESGAERGAGEDRERTSGHGSAKKAGGGKSG